MYPVCDQCEKQTDSGFYHEDSGLIVCSKDCGRELFDDFDTRTDELEIFWTTFEEWED